VAGSTEGYLDSNVGTSAEFGSYGGLTLGSDGSTLYFADYYNDVIRQISFDSTGAAAVSTLAGSTTSSIDSDGVGANAWFSQPSELASDGSGNLYISESGNRNEGRAQILASLRKLVVSSKTVSTFVYSDFGGTGGSADGTGSAASFNLPQSVVTDSSGNIYVSDSNNGTIRKIAVTNNKAAVTTIAGTAGIRGYADGTGSAASFNWPGALAISPDSSTLYIADGGNGTIRVLNISTGAVTTLAGSVGKFEYLNGVGTGAEFESPSALAVSGDGSTLYVADSCEFRVIDISTATVSNLPLTNSTGGTYNGCPGAIAIYTDPKTSVSTISAMINETVVSIDPSTGIVTPLAGSNFYGYEDGTGANALFGDVSALAADSAGNLYAADYENGVVRRITPAGVVTTLAGTYGDAATTLGALPGSIYMPYGIYVDSTNNLVITNPNAILTLVP